MANEPVNDQLVDWWETWDPSHVNQPEPINNDPLQNDDRSPIFDPDNQF